VTHPPARLARHGLVAVAVVAAALLLVTNGWLYAGVSARARELALAQGQVLGLALLAETRGPPQESDLADFVDAKEADGLMWVGFVTHEGELLAEAGARVPGGGMPEAGAHLLEVGERVRFFVEPPPPPPRGPRRPAIVLEFIPLAAADLRARSERALGVAAGGAALLVVAAALFSRQQRRAEAAERDVAEHRHLAGLGEMSAVLAHEIRNPLAGLKGHAQLLAELLPAGEPSRGRAERVVNEAIRLERLTDDLLAFARTGEIERADVDPSEPLRGALADLGGERVTVDVSGAPRSWSLDAPRMRRVLVNLLQNALQAAPGPVEAVVTREAEALVYLVRDHGPGVPAGEEQAIFEPFRTHRTRGTGLGLAVARRIVELHRGRIDASNHPDGGALFRISLPAVSWAGCSLPTTRRAYAPSSPTHSRSTGTRSSRSETVRRPSPPWAASPSTCW
jgi:two-component system sensor histidine kinase HydH